MDLDFKYLNYCHKEKIIEEIKRFDYIFLFLDYDGTLVEIKKTPDEAIPSERAKKLILNIDKNQKIIPTIVSGRSSENLSFLLGNIKFCRFNLIGNHGAEIKYPGRKTIILEEAKKTIFDIKKLKGKIANILEGYPCYYIEDKRVSFAIHYRNCGTKDLEKIDKIIDILDEYKKVIPVDYLKMKKVIDVKPKNITKGKSIKIIRKKFKHLSSSINICIGDDVTDEYLFKENKEGINIRVGDKNLDCSSANYYFKNVEQVHDFLDGVSNL